MAAWKLWVCNQRAKGAGRPWASSCSPAGAKGTASQGFTSKEEEAECSAADREKSWVVPEECLSPSLPLELELLPAELVQGARWCQALGVTA